jgi:hypothetical protein
MIRYLVIYLTFLFIESTGFVLTLETKKVPKFNQEGKGDLDCRID